MSVKLPKSCSRNKFVSWLKSQKDDAIIGIASEGSFCPISNWLVKTYPFKDHNVRTMPSFVKVIFPCDRYMTYTLPKWMSKFIEDVDTYYPMSSVTKKDCLDILGVKV